MLLRCSLMRRLPLLPLTIPDTRTVMSTEEELSKLKMTSYVSKERNVNERRSNVNSDSSNKKNLNCVKGSAKRSRDTTEAGRIHHQSQGLPLGNLKWKKRSSKRSKDRQWLQRSCQCFLNNNNTSRMCQTASTRLRWTLQWHYLRSHSWRR